MLKGLRYWVCASAILAAIVVVLSAWLIIEANREADRYSSLSLKARTERSSMVAYAIVKTNEPPITFVVQQVWKDTWTSPSSAVGLKIHLGKLSNDKFTEGAVIFFEGKPFEKDFEARFYDYINDGRVGGMSLQGYKKACGL